MNAKVTPLRSGYEAGKPSPYHLPAPTSLSQNGELANAMPQLRDWARHLAENSSIARSVLDSRVVNGIGRGLTYEPMIRDTRGELLTDLNGRIRRVLDRWRRSPDVTGELSGAELERLAWRAWDTDGEIFLRKIVGTSETEIPYRVQLVESDLCPYSVIGDMGSALGIVHNEWGRPLTYYLYRRRPADIYSTMAYYRSSELLPVDAENIAHLKRVVRPDQIRGLTLFHAVIFRIADIAEYCQSHRLAARASADLFASINRSPDWQPQTAPDGSEVDPRNWQFEHLQILDNLQAGETVNFHDPEHPNTNATDFLHEEMRQIAAGTRSSFSQIANVFDRAYAAQRLEIVHAWRLVEQDRAQFVSDLARPILYEEPLRWAIAAGAVSIPRRGVDRETIYDARIEGPCMPTIDPVKDRQADQMDQENGWDSRHAIIRSRGKRPADVDAEIEQDTMTLASSMPPAPTEETDDE